jgi:hypothetical protein
VSAAFLMIPSPLSVAVESGSQKTRLFADMTDEEKLLLIDWLPFGTRFEDLRKWVPDAPEPSPGATYKRRVLSNTSFKDSLLGQRAWFELGYENGRLYGAFWHLKGAFDAATSDSLHALVSQLYLKQFGASQTSEEADAEYVTRTRFWCWDGGSASVSLFGVEKPYRSIGGGFQIKCPNDPTPEPELYFPPEE